MRRSFSLPQAKNHAIAAALVVALLTLAFPARGATPDVCNGAKPRERLAVFLSNSIERPGAGLALDDALSKERDAADLLRLEAERYFLDSRDERISRLRDRFTFLFPEKVMEFYDLGVPVALSPSAVALRYRDLLWRHYIERFTQVEEAPGKDPYSIRFKVSLDLRLFCRYRQEISDLIAR